MRLLIASAVAMLVATMARAETQYTVVNRAFTVVNKCSPCTLCDDCQCAGCDCEALQRRLAAAKDKPFKTKPVTTFRQIVSTRAAEGHTHTCPNRNCPILKRFGVPNTFDHKANRGHNCQFCGASQTIVDRPGRQVTVVRTVRVDEIETPTESGKKFYLGGQIPAKSEPLRRAAAPSAPIQTVITRSIRSSGGCANCQYAR